MILMDDKGCKIHATVRKTLIYRFQSLISEGRVYQISFFGVGESGRDFRPTGHPFKINFDIHTSVRLVPNRAIDLSPYNFVPISDIMFKDLNTSFLIDVIGILTDASAEQEFEKDGGKQKRITIELDQDGARVECAFFGKYVDEVVGYLGSADATNAVVVVRQVSKMFMELQRFLESHDNTVHVISPLQDSAKKSTPEDDFLKQNDGKTIEQLKDLA
ncbi:replication factor A protein 1-like [Lotus japonicus]|uniref:replication factor A protein 1-like n=1 Tax=Lotus japonicus TaxID=34305 RepID=UPI0025881DC6|nr:replication factor A protein 1-like [Lotus japonicus]